MSQASVGSLSYSDELDLYISLKNQCVLVVLPQLVDPVVSDYGDLNLLILAYRNVSLRPVYMKASGALSLMA